MTTLYSDSALVNLDPKKFGPSQDLDHWSIRTGPLVNSDPFLLVNSDLQKKNSLVISDLFSWSIRTFSTGQFGPFSLVHSDLFLRSIWTSSISPYAKTKTQITFAVTAKLISTFVFATLIVHFLFFLNPKFQASSCLL